MHKITVEKPRARLKVTIENPSGKKEVRWVDTHFSVNQICEEYLVPIDSVRWSPMK